MKLRIFGLENGKKINKNLNYIKEIKLRDFQFKINNRILVTNSFLFKIKKKDSNDVLIVTKKRKPLHIYFSALGRLSNFGKIKKIWLERKANINLQVDLKNILSSSPLSGFLSYFITFAEYFIY